MEAFTSGHVSAAARREYLADHPWFAADSFVPCRGGWRMIGWQSQIDRARAYGRGVARGKGRDPHPFDR